MKVHYRVRSSPRGGLRPRAMRRRPVMVRLRRISRGMYRRSIELRNHRSGVLTLLDDGEGNMGWCDSASASPTPRSQRPAPCAYAPCAEAGLQLRFQPVGLTGRRVKPTPRRGELGNDWRRVSLSVRLGKAEGRNTSVYASEQSDRPIGPEKPPNKGSSTRDILATDLRR